MEELKKRNVGYSHHPQMWKYAILFYRYIENFKNLVKANQNNLLKNVFDANLIDFAPFCTLFIIIGKLIYRHKNGRENLCEDDYF